MAKINNTKNMKQSTKEIIELLKQGHTQWQVHKTGYPFGTVRYHYQKMFKPKQFSKFMESHKIRVRIHWEKTKELQAEQEEIKAKQAELRKKAKKKLSTLKAK